jgi:chromosome segregation ATPase
LVVETLGLDSQEDNTIQWEARQMTMDSGQLTQMVTWLDEEHRRDKAEIVRLQQRIERQEGELQDQSRVIQDLEGRMAGLQAQLLKFSQLEGALQQLKDEVVELFGEADERRQQEIREAQRVRAVERDNVSRAINEIRRDLQRVPRLDEEMGVRKAEQRRVSDSLLNIQQELNALSQEAESKLRSLPFLEDGRQQDAKRIAQLQQESLEALKRTEQNSSRLQMIEDVTQRQERDAGELKGLVAQLRTSQRDFIEGQLLEIDHFRRQIAEWGEFVEAHTAKIDAFSARMQEFAEAFREDRQVVANVERFQEMISREQAQVAELQRLAEERQKRQLEQWQEEDEKRWRKELLRWDHQWAEQAKRNQSIAERFGDAEERLAQHRTEIDGAWRFFESQITYQTQESRRWLGEMTRLLEQRPKKE